MSYDFSFLSKEWNELKDEIKRSQNLFNYDTNVSIYTSVQVCEKVIHKVLEIENIEKQKYLEQIISQLKLKNIIDESLNVKIRDIYNEYIMVKSNPSYKVSKTVAERCIAYIYDILKWYSDKYENNLSVYNLDFLDEYEDIKAELMDAMVILFNDSINLQRGYNHAIRNCRVAIEAIVAQIQIKSGIVKQDNLYNDIKSIEPVMGSAAIPLLHKIRENGNVAIHINNAAKIRIIKKEEAINIFNDTYNLAKVFSFYMSIQNTISFKEYKNDNNKIKNKNIEKNQTQNTKNIKKDSKPNTKSTSNEKKCDNQNFFSGNWKDIGYYKGEVKNGMRHGNGKFEYPDGRTYEGQWKDDKKNGKGIDLDKYGLPYEGYFKDDRRNGYGKKVYKDKSIYEGQWENSYRHGKGNLKLSDGKIYEGQWNNDRMNGEFKIIDPKIGTFVGRFKNDKIKGDWTLIKLDNTKSNVKFDGNKFIEIKSPNNSQETNNAKQKKSSNIHSGPWEKEGHYEGNIKSGKRHGNGKIKYSNGDIYEGNWIDDKKEGKGVYTTKDKIVYKGVWQNDKRNGEFTITYPGVGTYKGMCKNDKNIEKWTLTKENNETINVKVQDGKFVELNSNDAKTTKKDTNNKTNNQDTINGNTYAGDWKDEGYYEGDIKNGKRHGMGVFVYKTGATYNGQWQEDSLCGLGTLVYPNKTTLNGKWYTKHGDLKWFEGTVKYRTGNRYEGSCHYVKKMKSYVRSGHGKLICKNGDIYDGHWQCNNKDGKFVIVKQGHIGFYEGRYEKNQKTTYDWYLIKDNFKIPLTVKDNRIVGCWDTNKFKRIVKESEEKRYLNGNIYKGELDKFIIKSDRHGYGIMKYSNGGRYEGTWEHNDRSGIGKMTYSNGDVYEGQWQSGMRHGYGTMRYSNGDVYEGLWKNDRKCT